MMDVSAFEDLLAHWQSLPVAEGAKVPAKSTLSPEVIKPYLANVGIFERVDRYELQVRLFGTQLDEKFGKAMTGANLFDIHPREQWDFYADCYESMLDTPAGCRMVREAIDTNNRVIHGVNLALPMADEDGETRYLVGLLFMESDSILDDPMDPTRRHQTRVVSLEYLDLGYGLPANQPPLPA
jgi:hypothetical protein